MSHQAPRGRHHQQPGQTPGLQDQDQNGPLVHGPYAPQGQYPPPSQYPPPQSQYGQPQYGYQQDQYGQPPQGPPRKKHGLRTWLIIASAVFAAIVAIVIAVGNGGSSSPTSAAVSLLSMTGAVASGPAYTVTSSDTEATCSNGAAEADGIVSGQDVSVCMFPSNDQLESDISAGLYAASSAIVQVGQTTLIFVFPSQAFDNNPPPASVVQSVISKTGGENVTPAS